MRLLIIGMDGMDSLYVHEHVDELPTLKRFMDEGALLRVNSVKECITGPAWMSIYTGVQPSVHGIKQWQRKERGGPVAGYTWDASKSKTIWEILSEEFRLGVLFMPLTFPARRINGFMISGFPAPWKATKTNRRIKPWRRSVFPKSIAEYAEKYPTDMVDVVGDRRAGENEKVMAAVADGKVECAKRLTEEFEVDILAICFTMIDRTLHYLPFNAMGETWEQIAARWYQRADKTIADLMKHYDPIDTVVVSDHGGKDRGHTYHAIFAGLGESFAGGWRDTDKDITMVAPTLLYVLGIDRSMSQHMQGEIAFDMLSENKGIADKLKGLGYIE